MWGSRFQRYSPRLLQLYKSSWKMGFSRRSTRLANNGQLLQGVKVLDMSRVIAGPFTAQILADYGADVIKVEQIGKGDDTRYYKPPAEQSMWDASVGPMSNFFAACNRNKRSICLDLKAEEARDVVYRLVRQADVFIENFVPGKMDELGLGYEKLEELNPMLIYASVSGYGASGPWANRAGYDMIVSAEAGFMHITGQADGPPTKAGVSMIDLCTGLYLHGAIMAALLARQQTGQGQKVDASLFETTVSLLANVGMDWLNLGKEAQRWGTASPSVAPYDAWQTKDSYLATGASNEKQWQRLTKILGVPELTSDERFSTNAARVKNRDQLVPILEELFRGKTTAEWLTLFEGSGMPYGEINTMEKVFQHPQTAARNMVQTVEIDGNKSGLLKLLGVPVKFSQAQTPLKRRPPLLGEHTDEVLKQIGMSETDIDRLKSANIIQ